MSRSSGARIFRWMGSGIGIIGASAMLQPYMQLHAAAAAEAVDQAGSSSSFLPLDETQAKLKLVQVVFR